MWKEILKLVLGKNKKMRNVIIFAGIIFLISSAAVAQDCNCKHWKKTSIDNSGNISYQYEHKCSQPGTNWEYIGYDESYCNQLIQNEKNRLEDIKKTKEAVEISKGTKKQEFKDGYKVLEWWGILLGNTGKRDNVGHPIYGIKEDSTFMAWSPEGKVTVKGKIKNGEFNGLFILESDEDLNFQFVCQQVSKYFKIRNTYKKPDYVYYSENNFSTFENADLIDQSGYIGIYSDRNNIPFNYFLFNNGRITIFALPIDEENAIKIHNKIDSIETISEFNNVVENLTNLSNKLSIKKSSNFNFEQIKKNNLNEAEINLIGTWSFNSMPVSNSDGVSYLSEDFVFNQDRTYLYTGRLSRVYLGENTNTIMQTPDNGFWELKDNQLLLYSMDSTAIKFEIFKDKYSKKVTDLLSILHSIDIKNINNSQQWLELSDIRKRIKTPYKPEYDFFEYFVEPSDMYSKNIGKLYSLFKDRTPEELLSAPTKVCELKFEYLKSNKSLIKDLNFASTLLFKGIEITLDDKPYYIKQILQSFSNLTFTSKGKKQK